LRDKLRVPGINLIMQKVRGMRIAHHCGAHFIGAQANPANREPRRNSEQAVVPFFAAMW
jgi:hypothetical protein